MLRHHITCTRHCMDLGCTCESSRYLSPQAICQRKGGLTPQPSRLHGYQGQVSHTTNPSTKSLLHSTQSNMVHPFAPQHTAAAHPGFDVSVTSLLLGDTRQYHTRGKCTLDQTWPPPPHNLVVMTRSVANCTKELQSSSLVTMRLSPMASTYTSLA